MKPAVTGGGIQARAILDDFVRFCGSSKIGVADIDPTPSGMRDGEPIRIVAELIDDPDTARGI